MKVLYIQPIHPAGMEKLAEKFTIETAPDTSRETLMKAVADANAIVTRLTVVDREMMAAAKNLKAVAKHGVGVDNIDTEYTKEKNIAVLTTGDANSSSVAEHAMVAVGALLKRIALMHTELRNGNWQARDLPGSYDLRGRTLGIIGFGRIGQCLARMAAGFDMNVAVYDPFVERGSVEQKGYAYFDVINEMMPQVDIVSPHIPLTAETTNLINTKRLAAMKPGSYVLNFARGGVVDEDALDAALESGHIAGAALDVFEQEPPDMGKRLYNRPNVLISPHCATFSEDSRIRMSLRLADEIEKVLVGAIK